MELWRISNYADLSGAGGLRAAGRWHSRGKRVVYLADHPATALLETLVHLDHDLMPVRYRLLRLSADDAIEIQTIEVANLSSDWQTHFAESRKMGDEWLDLARSAILCVPSVIVPSARNYLLNPAHPDAARISIVEIIEAPFDQRLL